MSSSSVPVPDWAKDLQSQYRDTVIVNDYPGLEPLGDSHRSKGTSGADRASKCPADHSQAWYDGLKGKLDGSIKSAVEDLLRTMGTDPTEHGETVKDVQASVQSQWPAIMRRAGLAARRYDDRCEVFCSLNSDHPVSQLPGQDDPGKVGLELNVQFKNYIDISYQRPSGRIVPEEDAQLSRDIAIRAEDISFPPFHTLRTAHIQALAKFLESDWVPSHVSGENKAYMQETMREIAEDFSKTGLFTLEDHLADWNLTGGELTQVKAKISMESANQGSGDEKYTLFADYTGQFTLPLKWATSASATKWQSLEPMRAQIAELRLPPTSSKPA